MTSLVVGVGGGVALHIQQLKVLCSFLCVMQCKFGQVQDEQEVKRFMEDFRSLDRRIRTDTAEKFGVIVSGVGTVVRVVGKSRQGCISLSPLHTWGIIN